jgi:hypothetical protein
MTLERLVGISGCIATDKPFQAWSSESMKMMLGCAALTAPEKASTTSKLATGSRRRRSGMREVLFVV